MISFRGGINLKEYGTSTLFRGGNAFESAMQSLLSEYSGIEWSAQETEGSVALAYDSAGRNANYDGSITSVTLGQETGLPLGLAWYFDGTLSYTDIYTASLSAAFNPLQGSLLAFCKVDNAGVWGDLLQHRIVQLSTDASNRIFMDILAGNLRWEYRAGGISEQVVKVGETTTEYFMVAITWQKPGNMTAYFNGAVQGTPQAIAGTYVGALSATGCLIGAQNPAPTTVWFGNLTRIAFFQEVIPTEDIGNLWQKAGIA